ncbi:hypothetical protein [Bradyrhizobium sp. USDA 10063]
MAAYYEDDDDFAEPSRFRRLKPWLTIIALGVAGLFFWPLLVVAICWAMSRYRGPNHYTKFMVPYAYRFKWDAVWITIAVLGPFSWLVVWAGLYAYGAPQPIWALIAAVTLIVALLRVVVWLCFRFPLTSWFFVMLTVFLFGIGIRRFAYLLL